MKDESPLPAAVQNKAVRAGGAAPTGVNKRVKRVNKTDPRNFSKGLCVNYDAAVSNTSPKNKTST